MQTKAIDAVITWVDGCDRSHQQKLQKYLASIGNPKALGALPTRFHQLGEIHYCLRSLLHFAPWLRKIYIVTDAQIPPVVEEIKGFSFANKVEVIDHKEIFSGYEKHLPSFNSLSIESVLWRIPNLAEHFIYFNDDCFLVAPVQPQDFIRNEKLVLRGRWRSFFDRKMGHRIQSLFNRKASKMTPDQHRQNQENAAKLLGFNAKYFHLPHCPFILKKQTFVNYFTNCPELLAKNVSYPIREGVQFWPISLAMHLEIMQENYILDQDCSISVNPAFHSLNKIKTRLQSAKPAVFVCMQSMDAGDELTQRWLFNWLDERIPGLQSIAC
jgi:hypothetical protein